MANPNVWLGDREFHDVENHIVLRWIQEVVRVESPVHINEVALRIANAAFLNCTKRLRKQVGVAVAIGAKERRLRQKGNFLWRPDHSADDMEIRQRDDVLPSLRKPEMIAPEEIGAALIHGVKVSYGIDTDGAVTEASRLFGYKKTGANIQSCFKKALNDLIRRGVLHDQGGQLSYKDSTKR